MSQFDSFAAGTNLHLVTLTVFAVTTFLAIVMGQRLRGTGGEKKLRKAIGITGLIFWTAGVVRDFLPVNFSPAKSLPLEFCDVACVVACLMFLKGPRQTHSLTYFWGVAFTLQAFLTPTLKLGPVHPGFWIFWITHAIILGGAFYSVFVDRFRPQRQDFLFAAGTATAWMIFLVAFDVLTGSNYGFVGNAMPGTKTLIDILGPWPARLVWMYIIGISLLTFLWLPWHFLAAKSEEALAARSREYENYESHHN